MNRSRRITKEQICRGAREAAALQCSEGGEPPREIRIWKVGVNTDLNGYNVLWDAKAAKTVMAAYAKHGVRLSWDLEHLSLDDEALNYDPDARAHCDLELRNGELWATNIDWTPDGAERVTSGKQRYPSPAFSRDKDGRPTRVVNIALCARPATDCIEPLAAKEKPVNLSLSKLAQATKRVRALHKAGVDAATIIRTLADGAPPGDSGGEVAGVDIPTLAELCGIDIDPAQDPAGFVKALLAKLDEVSGKLRGDAPGPAEAPTTDPGTAAATPPEEMAAAKLMLRMINCNTFAEGALRMNEWRAIVTNHETAARKVADDQRAIETTERHALVMRLQACKAETPATSGLTDGKLVKRLSEEPIAQLRERVGVLELAQGIKSSATVKLEPGAGGGDTHGLSEIDLAMCARRKIDPAVYAAKFKAPKAPKAQSARVGG